MIYIYIYMNWHGHLLWSFQDCIDTHTHIYIYIHIIYIIYIIFIIFIIRIHPNRCRSCCWIVALVVAAAQATQEVFTLPLQVCTKVEANAERNAVRNAVRNAARHAKFFVLKLPGLEERTVWHLVLASILLILLLILLKRHVEDSSKMFQGLQSWGISSKMKSSLSWSKAALTSACKTLTRPGLTWLTQIQHDTTQEPHPGRVLTIFESW